MPTLDDVLSARLAELDAAHLRRRMRTLDSAQGPKVSMGGQPLLNFSSNDYLGLAWHPKLINAARTALEHTGTGAGASRLICGNLDVRTGKRLDECTGRKLYGCLMRAAPGCATMGACMGICCAGGS